MTVTEQFIYDTLTNYGYVGLFLALLLLGVISVIIAYTTSWLKDMVFTLYRVRKTKREIEIILDVGPSGIDLTTHTFFVDTNHKMRFDLPEMTLVQSKPVLSHMFHDLITMTVDCIYYKMEEIAKANGSNIDSDSGEAWGRYLRRAINEILDDIEERAIRDGAPITFVRRYMRWAIGYTDMVKSDISFIANTEEYKTHVIRTHTVLFIMGMLITSMVGDLYKLVHSANISGLDGQYHGRDIEV